MKILVSDYDKTFYINDSDIELNKKYIDEFMSLGNLFIINTGRSYTDLYKELNKYKFNYNYAILNHGATIIDRYDNIIFNKSIDDDIVDSLKKDLEIEKTISYFFCSKLENSMELELKNLTKINVRYSSENYAKDKNDYINNKYKEYVNCYYVGFAELEIISKDTSKKDAINYLMNLNNFNKGDIYTIGDSYSDIDMIKEFNGFCMKDSISELKIHAIKEYDSVSNLIIDIIDDIK